MATQRTSRTATRRTAKKPASIDALMEIEERTDARLVRLRSIIGQRCRSERLSIGVSLTRVARAADVNISDLSQIERGILYRKHLVLRVRRALRELAQERRTQAKAPALSAAASGRGEIAS